MVRGKFTLLSIKEVKFSPQSQSVFEYTFQATYDSTVPEDRSYSKYTPSGTLTMFVDNPPAQEQFKLGESYYLDLTNVSVLEAVSESL